MAIKKNIIITCALLVVVTCQAGAIYRRTPERTSYYHYMMGRIFVQEGNIKEAMRSLEKAVRLDPDSWIIRWDLLELYYITGNYYKGRQLAIKMYGMRPEDTHLLDVTALLRYPRNQDWALRFGVKNAFEEDIRLYSVQTEQSEAHDFVVPGDERPGRFWWMSLSYDF